MALAAAFLLAVVLAGGYRRVELIGLALGSFELAFLVAAALAHPRVASVAASLWSHQPLGSRSYLTLALGIAGAAALLASIVVSLAASWAVAEALGARRSLDDHPRNARLFYGIYTASVTVGAAVVLASHSIVRVAVDVEVLNALLLPVVIGFLVALAWRALPHPYRLRAGERVAIAAIVAGVAGIGLGWAGLTILPR
ncbi:MAG: divalent metal cation transporter [Solirubrobacteraceae bacterium]